MGAEITELSKVYPEDKGVNQKLKKKWTQAQKIANLEKATSNLYMMIQAIIDKLPKEENAKDKK